MTLHSDEFLQTTFAAVAPHLAPALVSQEALAATQQIAHLAPGSVASSCVFECRLGEPAPRADLACCIVAGNGARMALADFFARPNLPPAIVGHPLWQRVRTFCLHWADPHSPLHAAIGNVWLEFDVDGPTEEPLPSLFFAPAAVGGDLRWITDVALPLLLDSAALGATRQMLIHCLAQLPTRARLAYIGVMLPRSTQGVRLCVETSKNAVLDFLAAIGWPGVLTAVRPLVGALASRVDGIITNVDVGGAVQPGLGLEGLLRRTPQGEPDWEAVLAWLVAAGLCLPAKRDGLLAWPGYSHLGAASTYRAGVTRVLLVRKLNHIKLVYRPGAPLEAKGYLWFGHYSTPPPQPEV